MDGILNIDKPKGFTSHDVVARVRRIYQTKRVGHAGTLDPMATGVLPILIGKAASAQEYLSNHDKKYRMGLRLGMVTDSGDITGKVLSESNDFPETEEVLAAAQGFIGTITQIPPMYSAIKIGGKKLYELAREGKTVERQERNITVYSIDFVEKLSDSDYIFDVACSKGTYIRTLAEDIGNSLSCGGTLFSLERLSCGSFEKKDSVTLDDLNALSEKGDEKALSGLLISPEKVFEALPAVYLPAFYSRLSKNGAEIYLDRAKISPSLFERSPLCRLYDENGCFYALGQLQSFDDGPAIKATARFI